MRLTLCVMVFCIGVLAYADVPPKASPKEQAEAALRLAQAHRLLKQGDTLPLLAAEAQSRVSGLPLVIWVGISPPKNLDPMPPAVHTRSATWNGDSTPRVVLVRQDGRAASLPAEEVRRDPVAAVMVLVESR